MGEVVPARTSPTLHPPSPPTVHQLSSWLALLRVNEGEWMSCEWMSGVSKWVSYLWVDEWVSERVMNNAIPILLDSMWLTWLFTVFQNNLSYFRLARTLSTGAFHGCDIMATSIPVNAPLLRRSSLPPPPSSAGVPNTHSYNTQCGASW